MSGVPGEGTGRPRSWAILDLAALRANVEQARRSCPRGRLLAVLKADAYGHGAVNVAPAAVEAGAGLLGVGDSGEALELRRAGVQAPLLVLGDLVPSEIPHIVREGIIPVVHSGGRLAQLEREAARQGRVLPVHLKVDTGMGRLGMQPGKLPELARRAVASPHLELDGLMSHLAGHGPRGLAPNRCQLQLFAGLVADLARSGIRIPNVHLRNSTGILEAGGPFPGETLARTGALLLGFSPGDDLHPPAGYQPVMELRTQLVFLKDVPPGTPVGYDGTFVTRRRTRLGIIPFGYYDGMRRSLANRGKALLRGRACPVIGKVSMDYTTLDITDVPGAAVGDRVTLVGRDGDACITVEELASLAGTSPYELLCGLGRRVVRIPLPRGVPAA